MLNQISRLRNIELQVSYCGSGYFGWQIQPSVLTVQKVLQDILRNVLKDPVLKISGASRTDSGVHAHDQRVGFMTRNPIPLKGLQRTLNKQLPRDIRVGCMQERDADFSVRYSSKGKHYAYFWVHGSIPPFVAEYVCPSLRPLNSARMDQLCHFLKGTKSFRAFQSSQDERAFSETSIFDARVGQVGALVYFEVLGHSFLYHMVRNMARSLAQVGSGVWSEERWLDHFLAGDRKKMCMTAPACGLHLAKIFYDEEQVAFTEEFEAFKLWLAQGVSCRPSLINPSLDPY